MKMEFIKNYIKRINKDDIKYFLEDNDIYLDEEIINSLLLIVKDDYENIINEDEVILKKIKDLIKEDNYNKLLSILRKYKDLYIK